MNIEGKQEYEEARGAVENARGAYDAASEYGYPAREAAAMKEAEAEFAEICQQYPVAAAWGQANSWTYASNYRKVGAGKRAMERIEAGENHETVLTEMAAEWTAAAHEAVMNS